MSFLLIKEVVLCQPFLQNSFIKLLYCAKSIISAGKSLFKIGQGSKSSIQKDNFHGTFSQYKISGFCGALNQDEVQDLIGLMDGCNYFSTGFRQSMYYCIGYGADKSGFWVFSLFQWFVAGPECCRLCHVFQETVCRKFPILFVTQKISLLL